MGSSRFTGRVAGLTVLALAAGPLPCTDVAAQQGGSLTGARPGFTAGDAQLQRQLRSLERRGTGSPASAAIQLRRAQRDLVGQSRGVALTPDQARIARGLDRVGRELRQDRGDAATLQPPARPRGERLPGSVDDDAALPSFGGTVTLGRLVGRAETALAQGRRDQARSDLATARSLVGATEPGRAPDGSAALADLQARMTALEGRLAASGG
jgi:hypothetical protein